MAQELFTNGAQSTLSAGINNSTTSIGVADGSVFPATGNFRVRIDDEILLITSRSGNTLSVTNRGGEGTAAASHDSGAAVKQILTAASLRRATMEVGELMSVDGANGMAQGYDCQVHPDARQGCARGHLALARLSTAFVEASGLPSGWNLGDAQRIRISATAEMSAYGSTGLSFNGQGQTRDGIIPVPANATWLAHLHMLGVNEVGNICAWELHFVAQSNSAGTYCGVHRTEGVSNITPNLLAEFLGELTIYGNAFASQIQLFVAENTGLDTRWHATLDINELIIPDTGYGYGY